MTYLEAVRKLNPKIAATRDDNALIRDCCPGYFGLGDQNEEMPCDANYCPVFQADHFWDGESCQECWNKEVKIQDDDSISANDFQLEALRTLKDMPVMDQLTEGLMGLAGEAGEAIDILKKHKYQGHELDRLQLALELGDVAWYLATSAHALGYSLSEIFAMNVHKLQKRYPDGFDEKKSINREEDI